MTTTIATPEGWMTREECGFSGTGFVRDAGKAHQWSLYPREDGKAWILALIEARSKTAISSRTFATVDDAVLYAA